MKVKHSNNQGVSAPSEKYLTVAQLAEILQLGTKWILNRVKMGMPCIKLNARTFRFHLPTVQAWLLKQ